MSDANVAAIDAVAVERKVTSGSLPRRLFWWFVGITAVLLIIHLALQYLNVNVYNEKHGQIFELSNRFDMDDEVSVPSWFAQFALSVSGVLALLAVVMSADKGLQRLWTGLGVLGVLLALDEGAGLHEFVLQIVHLGFFGLDSPTAALNAWWVVIPFIVGIGLWILWYVWKHVPRKTFALMAVGGVLYVAGAVVMDLSSSSYKGVNFFYQGILTGVEETLELLGTSIVIYGVASYIDTHHGDTVRKAWRQLKPKGE